MVTKLNQIFHPLLQSYATPSHPKKKYEQVRKTIVKNLVDRLTYHSCPQSVNTEASFSILSA